MEKQNEIYICWIEDTNGIKLERPKVFFYSNKECEEWIEPRLGFKKRGVIRKTTTYKK